MKSASPFAATRRLVATAVVGAVVVSAAAVGCSKSNDAPVASTDSITNNTTATGQIVFPRPVDSSAAIRAANLPEMNSEAFVVHHHAHLDVNINGQTVVVPANIGITEKTISPLHTHDASGVLHIEAANTDTITLGQFFTEWGVKLDKNCVSTFCTDDKNQLLVFVDGKPVSDPTTVPLTEHANIFVWYGPKGTTPTPPVFDFKKAGV